MISRKKCFGLAGSLLVIFLLSSGLEFTYAKRKSINNGLINSTNCETRGVWVDEIENDGKVNLVIDHIIAANLNTVFIVSPPIGSNDGWSPKKQFDRFVKMAYRRGLNVHIWIPNLYRKKDGSQSDFRSAKERKAQKNWALALMKKYKRYVKGIHFDYIRYYDWESVSAEKLSAVSATINEVTGAVKRKYHDKFVTSTSISAQPTWADFGSESIPQWFRDWYAANPSSIYATSYSFATVPNYMKYQQDPIGWLRDTSLDAVMPMQYTVSDTDWQQEVTNWNAFTNYSGKEPTRICQGIGWLEEAGHPEWGYNAAGVANKIAYGRSQGLKGFVFYELNSGTHDQDLINVLTVDSADNGNNAPFKNKVQSCFLER